LGTAGGQKKSREKKQGSILIQTAYVPSHAVTGTERTTTKKKKIGAKLWKKTAKGNVFHSEHRDSKHKQTQF